MQGFLDFRLPICSFVLPYYRPKITAIICFCFLVSSALGYLPLYHVQTTSSCGVNQSRDAQQSWILGKREHGDSSTPPSRTAKKAKRSSTSFTAAAERSLRDTSSQGKESSRGGPSQQGGLSPSPVEEGWLSMRKSAKQQRRGAGGMGDGELGRERTVREERESEEPKEEEKDEALSEPALTEIRK